MHAGILHELMGAPCALGSCPVCFWDPGKTQLPRRKYTWWVSGAGGGGAKAEPSPVPFGPIPVDGIQSSPDSRLRELIYTGYSYQNVPYSKLIFKNIYLMIH